MFAMIQINVCEISYKIHFLLAFQIINVLVVRPMTATLHSVARHVAPVWKMIHSAQLIMAWKDVHVQEVKFFLRRLLHNSGLHAQAQLGGRYGGRVSPLFQTVGI